MRRALIITAIVLTVFAALVAIPQSQAGAQPVTTRPAQAGRTTTHRDPCRPGDTPCWRNHINRRIWMAEVARQQRYARLLAYAAAVAASQCWGYGCVQGIRVCGGDLPTCPIVWRESRFDPHAENPTSTASGLYQFIDGTFATCRTGYRHASSAPVSVQVSCARQIWNHGRGASHWRL